MNTLHPRSVQELPVAERLPRRDALWIDGDPSCLASPLVALVGTRDADPAGLALTRRIAQELVRAGVTVVSGGAIGIDAAAHRAAVAAGGRTVVVLPSGIGHWYPRRHEGLYRDVIAAGGALVSQFPPETPPAHWTFPRRNELVAELCDVMVVVQAPANSGALLAAAHARRLGRRLMAVPTMPGDRRGAGCLALLRAGALPCTAPEDVLETLASTDGPLPRSSTREAERDEPRRARGSARTQRELPLERPAPAASVAPLDEPEGLVYAALSAVAKHVDELARATGLSAGRVQHALLMLTLAGMVRERGDGGFVRA